MQEMASGGKPQILQSRQKSEPRELPAKDARPSGLAVAPRAADVPAIPTPEFAPPPAPAIPSASASSANRAWPMLEWAGSWQGGVAIFAAAFAIVTIGLEASRLMLRSAGSTPVSAASDSVTPGSKPAQAASAPAVSSQSVSLKTGSLGNAPGNAPSPAERATPDAQFEAAVAEFNRAVAAKDAAALRSHVLPEFQRIAQGAGPRAKDAAGTSRRRSPRPCAALRAGRRSDAAPMCPLRVATREATLRPASSPRARRSIRPIRSGFSSPGRSFQRRPARRVWATAWLCSR